MEKHDPEIKEKNLLQAVINAVPAPIFFKDAEGRYLGCNKAFEEYAGKSRDELIGKGVFDLFDEDLARVYFEADKVLFDSGAQQVYEAEVKYADGSIRDVMFHKAVFQAEDENVQGIVGVLIDITDRKQAEKEHQRLALTDSLTGLDNRHSAMNKLQHALDKISRSESSVVLFLLDLDNFKAVNDTYGHPTGDALLVEVINRLRPIIRKSDIFARLGGDEFVILFEDMQDMLQVKIVADKIIDNLSQEIVINNHMLKVGASIGIARAPHDSEDVEGLMMHADIALYQAKADGKGCFSVYDQN